MRDINNCNPQLGQRRLARRFVCRYLGHAHASRAGPRGLGSWVRFARQHGKKLALPEWGLSALDGSGISVETLPPCDQYTLQGDAFSRVVRGEIPLPYGVDDAVANMRVIDALFRSERSGRVELHLPAPTNVHARRRDELDLGRR